MTEEEWKENSKFLKDAEGVKSFDNGSSIFVQTIKELFPTGTRDTLYKEAEPFFKDFSLEFSPDLTTGPARINYHLVNIARGQLVTAVAAYLALLCSEYPKTAAKFYKAVELSDGLATPPRKYRGFPGTRGAVDVEPATLQLRLSEPGYHNHFSHFSRRKIEKLIGRKTEEDMLEKFVGPDAGFRWLQLAGAGGQGKSRMAYDLMRYVGDDWERGFLEKEALTEFQGRRDNYHPDRWRNWQPIKPHLIIIDYIIGREADIGYAMDHLADRQRQRDFKVPVCVLLIERQRWDRGGLKLDATGRDPGSGSSLSLGEGKAEWFDKLNPRSPHERRRNDLSSDELLFECGVIELKNLCPDDLVEIVRKSARREIKQSGDYIKEHLGRIDKAGRPLYAYFFSQALADGRFRPDWDQSNLLEYVFTEHCAKRWDNSKNVEEPWGECPKLSDDHLALRLAVLATMVRFVECGRLMEDLSWGPVNSLTRKQALALVGGAIDGGPKTVGCIIPGLEPDILGEWFVINYLSQGASRCKIIDLAWLLSPLAMADFIVRISQDFPNHPGTIFCLSRWPPKGLPRSLFTLSAKTIVISYDYNKDSIPETVYNALTIAASWGDGKSIIQDHFVEKLEILQKFSEFEFFEIHRKAEMGDILAMKYLEEYYDAGIGKNANIARFWLLRLADAGDVFSMVKLAVLMDYDVCDEAGNNEGYGWLLKACKAGYAPAMISLADCYAAGRIVEQSSELEFFWCESASKEGYAPAMVRLAQMLVRRNSTEIDLRSSYEWSEVSADSGYPPGMRELGLRYANGEGTNKDQDRAFDLILSSAIAGDIGSMKIISTYYDDGIGAKSDKFQSKYWKERYSAEKDNAFNIREPRSYT